MVLLASAYIRPSPAHHRVSPSVGRRLQERARSARRGRHHCLPRQSDERGGSLAGQLHAVPGGAVPGTTIRPSRSLWGYRVPQTPRLLYFLLTRRVGMTRIGSRPSRVRRLHEVVGACLASAERGKCTLAPSGSPRRRPAISTSAGSSVVSPGAPTFAEQARGSGSAPAAPDGAAQGHRDELARYLRRYSTVCSQARDIGVGEIWR
ncbi:hypothetical protein B0H11DRAFT_368539 [Mycena galericulata]|nr:hypothetical protein B0H11DRAFT_368539 [Mycena galericulata]